MKKAKKLIAGIILTGLFITLTPNTADAKFWGWDFNGSCDYYVLWIKVKSVECDG